MIITAKFSSVCPCCNNRVQVGSKVVWSRGEKAKHVSCPAKAAPKAAAPRLMNDSFGFTASFGEPVLGACEPDFARQMEREAAEDLCPDSSQDEQVW